MKYVLMFFATMGYVFLRALQQRNVAFDNYKWIPLTCYLMAILDIYVVATVAREGLSFLLVLTNGTAATCGCFAGIYLHKRFVLNGSKADSNHG